MRKLSLLRQQFINCFCLALAFYRALRLVGAATRYGAGDGYGHPSEALKPEESTGLFTVRIGDHGADLRQVLCKSFIWVRAFIVEFSTLELIPGTAPVMVTVILRKPLNQKSPPDSSQSESVTAAQICDRFYAKVSYGFGLL